MVDRLKPAIVSTPVSDCAISQEERTTTEEHRKQRSSEIITVQERVGGHGQASTLPSRALSCPAGHRDDAPVQTSPSLVASGPLGQQQSSEIESFLHSPSAPCTVDHDITGSRLASEIASPGSESHGADAALAEGLLQRSGNKKRFFFLGFPAEIRNMIYNHALHWPDCVDIYRSFYRQISSYPDTDKPHASGHKRNLKTPTILLLCRQITKESLPVLKSRWLVIDRLPPFLPSGLMKITNFIGRQTLQSLHHIDLRIGLGEGPLGSGWIWMKLLDDILAILSENNAFVKLRLLIRVCNDQMVARWDQEGEYSQDIRKRLKTFEKENPNVFAPGGITTETWRIEGPRASFVSRHPKISDRETTPPPDRVYPDREMFPGSIMQFVEGLPAPSWSEEGVASRLAEDW